MQVCTLLQTDNHASTPLLKFFTGRMPFLPPNQQRHSTEGAKNKIKGENKTIYGNNIFRLSHMIISNRQIDKMLKENISDVH